MISQNEPDTIIINFIYQSNEIIPIETDINNNFESVINEFSSRKNIDKASVFFLYNGNQLNPNEFYKCIGK